MNDENRLLKGATWYASQGWSILPCHGITDEGICTCGSSHGAPKDVGKHPAISEWQNKSSTDAAQIEQWWLSSPNNNVAVNCRPSGFFVLDIDPRSGGFESFDALMSRLEGEIPETVEAITGEYMLDDKRVVRGRHLFFRCDPSIVLKGRFSKDENLPGIDIKHKGYVLLAPSKHMSGVTYEWKPGHAPWEMEMAEINEAMLSVLSDPRKSYRSSEGSIGGVNTQLTDSDWSALKDIQWGDGKFDIAKMLEEGIDEGSRAVDIYALSCALANKFGTDTASQVMIESLLLRFNHEKVRPPMEVEGPNGLLMHMNRAIEFVKTHPKEERSWAGITEWQKNAAQRMSEGTFRGGATNRQFVNTSDPDDAVVLDLLPGTVGSAVEQGVKAGVSIVQAASLKNMDTPSDPDAILEEDGGVQGGRSLSDVGNGRRIVDIYGSGIRYTPVLGWHYWNGTHWSQDAESLKLRELAKTMASAISSETMNYSDLEKKNEVTRWAVQAKSNARIKAAIESATSDERIAVDVSAWDSDPYLLGVANGVIDLRTGDLRRGVPELYITKHAPIAYTPGLTHPRWQEFLDFATNGDKEYQSYLQRAFGYSLTGLKHLDVLFLVHGRPGSGKNTLIESFCKAIGMSAYAYPMETNVLAADDGKSSNTDSYHYAELRSRRVVWVDELPETERLKENAVKRLTGSATISARSPGEKPINFEAQAKLWITTNHKPMITDDAMWRRLRVLPWDRIPEVADPSLKAFLSDPEVGLPVILAWAVQGAMDFLSSKLADPLSIETCKVVYDSTMVYKKDEDRIGMFMREELVEAETKRTPIKRVLQVYRWWCEERGERPMTQGSFTRKLRDRGVNLTDDGSNSEIIGYDIKIKAPSSTENWGDLMKFTR